ncbi:MAG: hypothetical protein IPK82_13860 [Polyangiaceae bacterium]|nr:hypothetical protein [Polyangiaceae bacterium]
MNRMRSWSPKTAFCVAGVFSLGAIAACSSEPGPDPNVPAASATAMVAAQPTVTASASATPPAKPAMTRGDFNRLAAESNVPVFWIDDKNNSGTPDADEVAGLWGMSEKQPVWAEGGKLTAAFDKVYTDIKALYENGPNEGGLSDAERARRKAVRAELSQGRPAMVRSDFRGASAEDKAVVKHVLAASKLIERIYAKQVGVAEFAQYLQKDDPASAMLFYRNQSPFCEQPKTESDPNCSAIWPRPPKISGLYPLSVQSDAKFCETLEKRKDAKDLFYQFATVVDEGGKLKALAYTKAFKEEMTAISAELKKAADAVTSKEEKPFKEYLLAASKAFTDNAWPKADEAWAKMNVTNSKWYLRIGPDEVYFEPCSHKAGFHVSFARINQDSLTWQKKLEPVKKEMEETLAKMAGAPYKARDVKFHLPDFIDIVLNAGDSRDAVGATIGQSLPNWGPVAAKGGRTVAMTNLYTDKDSLDALKGQVNSVFCSSALDMMSMDAGLLTMSTVLHEAAHNLGPAHEYKVDGKTDTEVFGGPLASTLEELKAQTSALFFVDWLAEKGLIDKRQAGQSHLRDLAWGFGHIAQGMYDADKKPKPYSQLAAIQVGWLMKAGAVKWMTEEKAANGADKGCFAVDMPKFAPAVVELEKVVLAIKAKGDKDGAIKLRTEHVDADGEWKNLRETIRERWLRVPKTSFVYSIDVE